MNNYRKLLFAGLAIVPLALSSWTSEDNGTVYNKSEYSDNSFIVAEINGQQFFTSTIGPQNNKRNSLNSLNEDKIEIVTETVIGTTKPILTIDRIVKDYK